MADVAALLGRTINDTLKLENSLQRARAIGYLAGLLINSLEMVVEEQRRIAWKRNSAHRVLR